MDFAKLATDLPDFTIENTGGNVMVAVLVTPSGRVVAVSDEAVCVYRTEAIWNGEDDTEDQPEQYDEFATYDEAIAYAREAVRFTGLNALAAQVDAADAVEYADLAVAGGTAVVYAPLRDGRVLTIAAEDGPFIPADGTLDGERYLVVLHASDDARLSGEDPISEAEVERDALAGHLATL